MVSRLVCAVFIAVCAPLVAHAGSPKLAIAGVERSGEVTAPRAQLLTDALRSGALRAASGRGFEVVGEVLTPEPGCVGADCLFEAAADLGYAAILTMEVTRVDSDRFATLRLYAARPRTLLGSRLAKGASVNELITRVPAEAEQLVSELERHLSSMASEDKRARVAEGFAALAARCESGEAKTCIQLGFAYRNGEGVPKDVAVGASYLEKACEKNYPDACRTAGAWYAQELSNPAVGVPLYEKACNALRDAPSCVFLAQRLEAGKGVPRNAEKGARYYEKACRYGDTMACVHWGDRLSQGTGVARNEAEARNVYERACRDGHGGACRGAAFVFENRRPFPNYREAATLYSRGCELGDAGSCWRIGSFYESGYGFGVRNAANAERFYAAACDKGSSDGCVDRDRLRRVHAPRTVIELNVR